MCVLTPKWLLTLIVLRRPTRRANITAFGIALETRRPSGESDGQNDFDLQNPPQMLLRIGRDQYGSIARAPLRGGALLRKYGVLPLRTA